MSALLGIFIGPVLGSVVDAFGPRSTLLLSAACSTLRPIVFLALPNVSGLVISEILNAQNCANTAWAFATVKHLDEMLFTALGRATR